MGLGRYDALGLTALVWFLAKFLRYAFPPLFPTFAGEFAVSNALLGTAFSAMMGVYALTQFPSGALADRFGAVRVVVGGAVVAAGGAVAVAVPASFAVLVVAMGLVGLGTGAHKTVAVGLLSRIYPDRTGRALGALDTLGALGGVAAPAAVVAVVDGRLASLAGWRSLFLVAGVVGLGLAGATWVRVAGRVERGAAIDREAAGLRSYLGLFRTRRLAAFVGLTLLFSFAYNGAVAFLPLFLAEAVGLTATTANLLYSGLFAVSLVQLVTGDLGDRVGQLPVIAGTLALGAGALGGLVALGGDGASAVLAGGAVVGLGVGAHGFRPVRGAYLLGELPEAAAGGALGVVRTLLMGAGAVAPAVVGVVADATGFGVAFALLAAAMAGAAAVGIGLLATAPREPGPTVTGWG